MSADSTTDILLNQTIKKVGDDIEALKFNTAISALMILSNHLAELPQVPEKTYATFLQLLLPLAPHITHELAEQCDFERKKWEVWPVFDQLKIASEMVTIVLQINGKVRGNIKMEAGASQTEVEAKAREILSERLAGKTALRTVYVQDRLINVVLAQ